MTHTPPPVQPTATPTSGLAVAALIVGIGAFLFGLVPFVGIVVALVGITLAIVALTKPGSTLLPAIGLALSGIAVLANVAAIIFVLSLAPNSLPSSDSSSSQSDEQDDEEAEEEDSELTLVTVSAPCFTFEAPEEFINNQSTEDDELCFATREGWGEMDEDGVITYTGVGAVWDQVLVEPIRVETSATMAPDGEVDTMIDYLETNYFPQLGEIISLREAVTVDGQDGNISYFDSSAPSTVTKATIVVKSAEPYDTANGPVQFFLVTFVIDDDRGDQIIAAAVDSWSWQ